MPCRIYLASLIQPQPQGRSAHMAASARQGRWVVRHQDCRFRFFAKFITILISNAGAARISRDQSGQFFALAIGYEVSNLIDFRLSTVDALNSCLVAQILSDRIDKFFHFGILKSAFLRNECRAMSSALSACEIIFRSGGFHAVFTFLKKRFVQQARLLSCRT